MTMRIYMIRHAQSTANSMKVWTGQTNAGLSDEGAAALRAICARYDYPRCDLYFSSPLRRCTESMEIIYGRAADFELAELAECDMGELAGVPYTSLDDDPNYFAWIGKPEETPPWKGESFGDFRRRAERGFLRILEICRERGAESAAAVMHGDVMRAALHRFADPTVGHWDWKIPNGGVYALECGADGRALSCEKLPEFLFAPLG